MNFLESLIPTSLAESIGLTFMHALWQLAAVALLLLLVIQFVPRKASRTRYLLGTGALVLMPLLAITTFFMVHQPSEASTVAPDVSAMLSNGQILQLDEHFAGQEAQLTYLPGVTEFFNENARLLFALWVLGSMLFAMRFVWGYARVQRLRKRNTEPVPSEIEAILTRLSKKIGLTRAVQVLQSGSIDTPMVIGALRPVVLLPVGLLSGLSPEQIECILAHELAHIKRNDYLINIFQSMVEILFFFHPAVWWVSNMVREERENCCDETVLSLKNDNMVYARALLNLESLRSANPNLAMASNGGSLFKRIKRITGAEARETRFYSRGLFVAMLTLTLIFVVSTSASEEMKASSPMMAVSAVDPSINQDPPQTPPASTEVKETAKETKATEVKRAISGMEKMLAQVAEIPKQVALSGNQLRTHVDNALFAAVLSEMRAKQDSPVTKLTLMDNGKEIVMEMGPNGAVERVMVDGKEAPKADHYRYKRFASEAMRSYLSQNDPRPSPPTPPNVGNMPPMPPTPAIKSLPPMPPMPTMPKLGNMPNPPAPPAKGDMSEREYKRAMEAFEEAMEDWGENIEANFEGQDWDRFEREMEIWGENLEKSIEGQDWDSFGEEMEKWGEELAAKFENQDWEKFGAEMEQWGEELARTMAEKGERMAHNRATHHHTDRLKSGVDRLADELVREGLIDDGDAYKLKINEDELFVNGNRQADGVHRRFKNLIEDELGLEVEDEWVEINKKKGSVKIKNEN